jgi:methyl-accepting chemotaxis protein
MMKGGREMSWLDDKKMASKMAFFIVVVSVFLVAVGLIGYVQIKKLDNSLNDMYGNKLRAVKNINDMSTHLRATEADALQYMLADISVIEAQKLLKDKQDRALTFDQDEKAYENTALDSWEKEHLTVIKQELPPYRAARDHAIALASQGQKAEAYLYFKTNALPHLNKLNDVLKDMVDYTARKSDQAKNAADQASYHAVLFMLGITILALALSVGLGLLISQRISRPLRAAAEMAAKIADGDLTVEAHKSSLKRKDEIGSLARAFSEMVTKLAGVITGISSSSNEVASSSQQLSASAQGISANMEEVTASTEEIAAGLEEVSASAQEMNASAEEINASLIQLASEAEEGNQKSKIIAQTAKELQANASQSKASAENLYFAIRDKMESAMEEAKIVDEISTLAENIAGIASQTNLLALNAAIEAARAGDNGRGFAVVADEVRQLAEESAVTVTNIQELTGQVQKSIKDVVENANNLLDFMNKEVLRDYSIMVKIGKQYGDDADMFAELTERSSKMNAQIVDAVGEVTKAIESVAATIQQSAGGAQEIAKGADHTSSSLVENTELVALLSENAAKLNDLIQDFRLK